MESISLFNYLENPNVPRDIILVLGWSYQQNKCKGSREKLILFQNHHYVLV